MKLLTDWHYGTAGFLTLSARSVNGDYQTLRSGALLEALTHWRGQCRLAEVDRHTENPGIALLALATERVRGVRIRDSIL
ncbi:hypothetical protein [Halomonas sp.]|uniref:hypothetical protein n=1 Tax=Halomonas sp. TaxID=1486246 RepID=UPI003F9C84AB